MTSNNKQEEEEEVATTTRKGTKQKAKITEFQFKLEQVSQPWRGVLAGHGARASSASRSFFFDCATHVNKHVNHTVKKGNSCAAALARATCHNSTAPPVARVIITPPGIGRRPTAAPAAAAALS